MSTTAPTELRKYELMLILSGALAEGEFAKELEEVRKLLAEDTHGISHEDVLGLRDFTYRFKRQNRGYYAVFNFTASPPQIAELRNAVRLNPVVLRHMLITIPEDYTPISFAKMLEVAEKPREDKKFKKFSKKVEDTRIPTAPAPVQEKKASPAETLLSGKEDAEKLKRVEKKLEEILENPDIDVR